MHILKLLLTGILFIKKNMEKVFVYCRKSSEQEDRQVLSLDSQEIELKKVVESNNLLVVQVFKESASAHVIGRKVFNEMLTRIENGEAQGLVVWDESRIARNSLDGGKVIYMMDLGQIKAIYKPGKIYKNTPDDKSWMSMVFMMSKKESDDKGVNVKRGMNTKAQLGWMPSSSTLGYKNTPDRNKGFKIIIKDEERFDLVKRLFTEIVKGKQPISVYREASEVWKLTNQYGKIFSRSTFYNIITKPFYYGEYEYPKGSGVWIKGIHEPMITREEFDVVQRALGKFGKPVQHTHTFDLTGIFRCEVCGSAITASKKIKHYLGTGRIVTYIYYHCTKKNTKIKCNSKPLTQQDIMNQIDKLLIGITPSQKFVEWSNRWLSVVHKDESGFKEEKLKVQQSQLSKIENRLNVLLDMKLDGGIDDQGYKEKKQILEAEKNEIKAKLDTTSDDLDDWRTKVENTIEFARVCQYKFNNGTREDKQVILMTIGANLILNTNKLLDVKLKTEYEILANKLNWEEKYKGWLEPQKYTEIMDKYPDLRPPIPAMLPRVDSDHEPSA